MISASPTCSRSLDRTSTLVTLSVLLAVAVPCFGQGDGGAETGSTFHPFAFGFAGGGSAAPDTKVYDVRMPIGYTLIEPTDERWGLRLRLIVYAGVYDFTADDAIDLDFQFQSLAATPGVEFLVPVGDWVLKPFSEIGYARDFDNDLGFGVWSVGMRTLVTWPVGKIDLSFGTKVQYFSEFTSDLNLEDDFGEMRIGLDARHPLPFTIGGNQGDLSLYYIRRQYIDAVIKVADGDNLEVRYTNEIGFSFGTTPKIKLWFFRLPRIGLGYRWGPNVSGFRLNFGFPF